MGSEAWEPRRENRFSIGVHLNDPAVLGFHAYPDSLSGPFVSVELDPTSAVVMARDVDVLDALAVQVAQARAALAAMLDGRDPSDVTSADFIPASMVSPECVVAS